MMFNMDCAVYLPKTAVEWLQKYNLEQGGLVQVAINNAVMSYCQPYVPFLTGTLAQSCYSATDPEGTEVVWPGPYAKFQYYGHVMTDENGRVWVGKGEEKPIVTNRELQYTKDYNPMAGAYWFERMKADHLDDIVEEARKVALGK